MSDARTCTSCAAEIPAGARFCTKCGTEAPLDAPAAPAAPAEPAAPAPAAPHAGAGDVPTAVPPGGMPQTAPTQPMATEPTWSQPQQGSAPVAPGYAPAGGAPVAPTAYGAATPPVSDFRPDYGQQGAWPQAGGVPAAPPSKAKVSGRTVFAALVGFLGALAFGVASFLPWAEIDSFRGISGAVVTGWDALTGGVQDGLPFVMVAVVAGALSAAMLSGRASLVQKLLLVLAGAIGIGMSVYEITSNMTDIDDINDFGGDASLGYGLWVALAGGVLILIGGLLAKRTKREPAATPVGVQDPAATVGDPRAVGAAG